MTARLAIVAAIALAAVPARADVVRHVPPGSVTAGTEVELAVRAAPTTPTLTVHYRTAGATAFTTGELVLRGDRWIAIVPAAAIVAPGLDYYLTAGDDAVFASAEAPHTLPVLADDESARRARDLARTQGRHSQIRTAFEWVSFGTAPGATHADRYYRIDADFAYRLWTYPLEEIRVGYTRLIGDQGTGTTDAGFKVGGWFELGLAAIEGVHIDARGMVFAATSGFGFGARGEARLGDRDGSHVAIGAEWMKDVGANGFFRLGWGTVPNLPMAATVEITQLPEQARATGVRLYYDIATAVGNGVRVGLRVGYAARNQTVAGFTSGATASVEF